MAARRAPTGTRGVVLAVLGATAAGFIFGMTLSTDSFRAHATMLTADSEAETIFGHTPDGRSYGRLPGPDAQGRMSANVEMPDLAEAMGDNGEIGYLDVRSLEAETPTSPEEALKQQRDLPRTVPLYGPDGVTIVDMFTIGRGSSVESSETDPAVGQTTPR